MGAASEPIEAAIGMQLRAKGYRLALAESCTGGLIAHRITNVPGASQYLLGGIVAYSNEVKVSILGVEKETIDSEGAVSEPVAKAMAEGACERFGADLGIGVTGIAGPDGGTPDKPVGLVFIALAVPGATRVERRIFSGDREAIKQQTAERSLELLLEYLS